MFFLPASSDYNFPCTGEAEISFFTCGCCWFWGVWIFLLVQTCSFLFILLSFGFCPGKWDPVAQESCRDLSCTPWSFPAGFPFPEGVQPDHSPVGSEGDSWDWTPWEKTNGNQGSSQGWIYGCTKGDVFSFSPSRYLIQQSTREGDTK